MRKVVENVGKVTSDKEKNEVISSLTVLKKLSAANGWEPQILCATRM